MPYTIGPVHNTNHYKKEEVNEVLSESVSKSGASERLFSKRKEAGQTLTISSLFSC